VGEEAELDGVAKDSRLFERRVVVGWVGEGPSPDGVKLESKDCCGDGLSIGGGESIVKEVGEVFERRVDGRDDGAGGIAKSKGVAEKEHVLSPRRESLYEEL